MPEWWPSDLRDVLQSGWDPVPSKRMRLAEAATRLRQMLKALENGTDPLFMDPLKVRKSIYTCVNLG